MTPNDLSLFGHDPWWVVLFKVIFVFVLLLVVTIFNVWYERRLVGKMQHRRGPIMNGPLGLGQALGDGAKLILKEDFRPAGTDKWVFTLAPLLTGIAAFTAWSVIPLAGRVPLPFWNANSHAWDVYYTQLQLTDLPVGVLFVLAIASVGIYGIVLAGWASSSTYALLGGIRSTAQMISYEIAMGLALVAVFLKAGTMSTSGIVEAQSQFLWDAAKIPGWYFLLLIPSAVIYIISMVAETNRAPFDLVECEQELVSGYLTDYSGFRYAIYFLAEYINMATVSAVATTLFFGGYRAPWPVPLLTSAVPALGWLDSGWMGLVWFLVKIALFIALFVWLRGTLPRLKYDQLMHLGWKWLIPISIGWIVVVAVLEWATRSGSVGLRWLFVGLGLVLVGVFVAMSFFGKQDKPEDGKLRVPTIAQGEYDPFAGGYPVPPMPGQVVPGVVKVVRPAQDAPVENKVEETV